MSEFIGQHYTKRVKQLMRALGETAYERELGRALQQLDADFAEWRGARLSPVELTEKIHTFHDKTARELYKWYWMGSLDGALAVAIRTNIVTENEVDPEMRAALEHFITPD